MIHIALLLSVILAPASSAREAKEPHYPKGITQLISQIRPYMSHNELMAVIKKQYPKAHSIGETWGGGGGTLNFDLDGRYSLSLAEAKDLSHHQKEPRQFVQPSPNLRIYDGASKRIIYPDDREPKKDCPVGTHAFIGLKGSGCCKDGAICD